MCGGFNLPVDIIHAAVAMVETSFPAARTSYARPSGIPMREREGRLITTQRIGEPDEASPGKFHRLVGRDLWYSEASEG